jgi:hypothetical protein
MPFVNRDATIENYLSLNQGVQVCVPAVMVEWFLQAPKLLPHRLPLAHSGAAPSN